MFDRTKSHATFDEIDEAYYEENRIETGCERGELVRDLVRAAFRLEFHQREIGWNPSNVEEEIYREMGEPHLTNLGKPVGDLIVGKKRVPYCEERLSEFEVFTFDLAAFRRNCPNAPAPSKMDPENPQFDPDAIIYVSLMTLLADEILHRNVPGATDKEIIKSLANRGFEDFSDQSQRILCNLSITKDAFARWLTAHDLEPPRFWFGDDQDAEPDVRVKTSYAAHDAAHRRERGRRPTREQDEQWAIENGVSRESAFAYRKECQQPEDDTKGGAPRRTPIAGG